MSDSSSSDEEIRRVTVPISKPPILKSPTQTPRPDNSATNSEPVSPPNGYVSEAQRLKIAADRFAIEHKPIEFGNRKK